ncbi:MAG TPA: hypothetical protein VNG33_15995, partial [Polyangiaceae bacterium]|nr:hypothetical protein [Polyangiaceae bacterium]
IYGEEISRIEAEIRALTPPADACARAERCCKAATPLLEPGEVCNVGFQLGPDYFPDHCQKTYKAFQTLLEAKHLKTPQDCRAP